MNTKLASHLIRSSAVRSALKKEALRLLLGVVIGIGVAACIRYLTGRIPSRDGLLSIAFGIGAILLLWIVSLVRTIRAALRDQSLL